MTTTDEMVFEHAAAMPAPTWNFLKMNDAQIDIPAGLEIDPQVAVSGTSAREANEETGAFAQALAAAQEAWEANHPAPTAEELAAREEFMAAEADATYGGTARSGYQIGADAIEESRSLAIAFENGTGEEASAYLRYAAGDRIVVRADAGQDVAAQVVVSAVAGAMSVAAVDIVAGPNSAVDLSIVAGSAEGELPADKKGAFTGTTVRVFAGEGSRVNIARTQALPSGVVDVDDMGLYADERATIHVAQTVLGAERTFTGLATDLRGDSARIDISTHYLGHGEQAHDFNYIVRHHGQKTECDLQANGVLAGKSRKTLRGTIDLIRGAKGAQGSENETVLLVDDDVQNKTVPVILCNEDDVAGNHGATIGHIRDEQMFYLASRGLSREVAEQMFVGAIMEQAAIDAPDEDAREAVVRLGESVAPGFAALFD